MTKSHLQKWLAKRVQNTTEKIAHYRGMSRPDPNLFNTLRDDLLYFEQIAEIVEGWQEPKGPPPLTSQDSDKQELAARRGRPPKAKDEAAEA